MRASEAPVVLVFLCDSDFRTVSRRWLQNEVRIVIAEINGSNYSFDRASSKTSTLCSTLLFAVKSSLPTVTLTGSRWNVLAKRRTASGQVALTIKCPSEHSLKLECQHNSHIIVCRSAAGFVLAMIFRISFSKPLSSILSASSKTR